MNAPFEIAGSPRAAGRVLIVSFWFPPFNAIAAIRAGKLAKHLRDQGWDVRVLTAADTGDPSLAVEIPRESVTYTSWTDVDRHLEKALGRLRGRSPESATPVAASASPQVARQPSALRKFARQVYKEIVRWPDNRVGWLHPAVTAGNKLLGSWRPDVIFATAPPPTTLLVADRLSRTHNVPWVAEFRDLWSDNPYYEYSSLRRWLERAWDQRVLTRASALVTVSPAWKRQIEVRYGRPTIVAMNGFVAEDFPEVPPVMPEAAGPLRIVYTGHIYQGYRDPTPLFEAIREVGATRSDLVVDFIGGEVESVRALATGCGVGDLVQAHPPVSYRRALELQLHADVLLHLQWCDPKDEGTIAGKIFDYLYTRRPILGIALEDSVAAKMIHERKAGLVTNNVAKIAAQLRTWLRAKQSGGVAPLPASSSAGLERAVQFEKIRVLLEEVAGRTVRKNAVEPLVHSG